MYATKPAAFATALPAQTASPKCRVPDCPAGILRSIRKADQVAAEVVAATVANLKLVRPSNTRVIVMDRGDGRAIDVAKALGTVGCRRAYVLSGGFGHVPVLPA